jgi:Zn-dependent peptidase ImmA (M78 family)
LFSLLHEFIHVGIGVSSFYNVDGYAPFGVSETEMICNASAAEILAPNDVFRRQWSDAQGLTESRIREVAGYFRCSQMVIARRALDNKFITRAQYQALAENAVSRSKRDIGGDYYTTNASRIDHRFLWALEASLAEGQTAYTEAYRLTNTNRSTFDKLFQETRGERR